MPVCDGCGQQVSEVHIRERITRLELATRFRPVHVKILLFGPAPPQDDRDYFYRAAANRTDRAVPARMFFDELAVAAGISRESLAGLEEDGVLGTFQRQGFFLAYAVECPPASPDDLSSILDRLAPTAIRRIQTSYRPKHVLPLGSAMSQLLPLFQMSSLRNSLILSEGAPFDDPFLGDPQNQAEFNTFLGDRIARACAVLS